MFNRPIFIPSGKIQGLPAGRIFATGLALEGVDHLAIIPLDMLGAALDQLLRRVVHAAVGLDGDHAESVGFGDIHPEAGLILVLLPR